MSDQDKEVKFKEFFEKARKGVLKYLNESGGSLPMDKLHDYSLKTYLIQHQKFSQLMETSIDMNLIKHDEVTGAFTITEQGKEFIK